MQLAIADQEKWRYQLDERESGQHQPVLAHLPQYFALRCYWQQDGGSKRQPYKDYYRRIKLLHGNPNK